MTLTLGPFTYGGTLVRNGDVGYQGRTQPDNYTGNTHGGMVQIGDQWYIFCHRQTNKQKCARQGCAEKLTILPDGSIPQVEMTSCGLNPGPLMGKGSYEVRIACNLYAKEGTFACLKSFGKDKKGVHPYFAQSGEDREENGDQYIANMRNEAVAGFKYFSFDGLCRISVEVRGGFGAIEVYTDLASAPIAKIFAAASAEWTTFDSKTTTNLSGVKPLYFVYKGTDHIDFNRFELK